MSEVPWLTPAVEQDATTAPLAKQVADLYATDFYAWTLEQAEVLRTIAAGARQQGEAGQTLARDFDHLAEEIEDVGKAERNACQSHVRRIIEHLLKLEYSPAQEPRAGWRSSARQSRIDIQDHLTSTIQREIVQKLPQLYGQTRALTADRLREYGEAGAIAALPPTCPYTLEQLLDDDWYPTNRHGLVDPV